MLKPQALIAAMAATLALTGFVLLIELLGLAAFGVDEPAATLARDA